MSRVFEALQKSQGDNPSASPLVTRRTGSCSQRNGEYGRRCCPASRSVPRRTRKWLHVPADRVLHPAPTPEQRLVALTEPNGKGAEMFRVLATRLAHMQNKRRLQKLLITSSVGDEGKSVVAVNLALTLARRHDGRTLLIEADLRRPSASTLLTSSTLRGISDWDAGKLALEDSLYQVRELPLWFLSAGHGMEEPLPLLESDRFAKMLETISSNFDWVIARSLPPCCPWPMRLRFPVSAMACWWWCAKALPAARSWTKRSHPSRSPNSWAWCLTKPPC